VPVAVFLSVGAGVLEQEFGAEGEAVGLETGRVREVGVQVGVVVERGVVVGVPGVDAQVEVVGVVGHPDGLHVTGRTGVVVLGVVVNLGVGGPVGAVAVDHDRGRHGGSGDGVVQDGGEFVGGGDRKSGVDGKRVGLGGSSVMQHL